METIIVFSNKEEKERAEIVTTEGGYDFLGKIAYDYIENGSLKNIEKWADIEGYGYVDFIFFGGQQVANKNGLKIFSAMPDEWKKEYMPSESDEPEGYFIASMKGWSSTEAFIKKISDIDFEQLSFWFPPKIIAINNSVIVNHADDGPVPTIKGLLGAGESLLISGSAGIGKSLLVNYLAYTLANRENLWGQMEIPKPVTSLILQSEVDLFAQKNRLKKLLSANPDFKSDKVFTLKLSRESGCQIAENLTDEIFQKEIINAINTVGADVLFIDPLISFNPVNENDNTQMRKVLDSFMDAIKETGVSVIFTHHMNKSGGTRGASAIRDWAANAIELRLDKVESGEARVEVTHDKARNFEQINPFYLRRTKNLSFDVMRGDLNETDIKKIQCVIDAIAEFGGEVEGQLTLAKLIGKNGIGTRTALKRIKDAVYFGLIFENKIGHGLPSVYSLPA